MSKEKWFKAKTEILKWILLDQEKTQVLGYLIDEFKISSTGVAIIFDDEDYDDHENDVWRCQGNHLNIEEGGIEDLSPSRLYNLMDSLKYSNIIWISKRISAGELIEFTWVVAHEFQHYEQDSICHEISISNHVLLEYLKEKQIPYNEFGEEMMPPYEFDAELAARRVVTKLLGEKAATSYMKGPDNKTLLEKVANFDTEANYDLINSTLILLEKYFNQLVDYSKTSEVGFIKKFSVEKAINELIKCQKLEQVISN